MRMKADDDEEACAIGSSAQGALNHSPGEVPRNDGSAGIPGQDNVPSVDGNGIDLPKDNGDHDHLVQTILELRFQNEYFNSQIENLEVQHLRGRGDHSEHAAVENEEAVSCGDSTELHEKVRVQTQQIQEQKETQIAGDDALKHLRSASAEADTKVAVSAKLVEAAKIKEQEISERDEKYSGLDSKLGRLHKLAKKRIQELQKEKDDLEANLREVNWKAALLSSQLALVLLELGCNRQKASEPLWSLDSERQQLQTTNNKLCDNLDELSRSIKAKETTLDGVQQALAEKGQEKEKDNWEASIEALEAKLKESENACLHSEIESAKTRSELELQLAVLKQQLNAKDLELLAVKDEVRVHALLQKKEAELSAAKEREIIQAFVAVVKEAGRELAVAAMDRDSAHRDLNYFHSKHDEEISARDMALSIAEKRISDMEADLSSVKSLHLFEKEAWQQSLKTMEEAWRIKCEALEAQVNAGKSLEKELESLKLQYNKLYLQGASTPPVPSSFGVPSPFAAHGGSLSFGTNGGDEGKKYVMFRRSKGCGSSSMDGFQ